MLFVLLSLAFQTATPPPPDAGVYLAFFNASVRNAEIPTSTYTSTLNGEPGGEVSQLSVADSLGLTSGQARSLVEIGSLCQGDVEIIEAKARALTFEARLRAANDDKPSETIAEQLKALEIRRAEIIASYVEKLRETLGAERFRKLDSYVRAHGDTGSFFPKVMPAPRKKI